MSSRFAAAATLLGVVLSAIPLSAQTPDSVIAPLVAQSRFVRLKTESILVTGKLIALSGGVATLQSESGAHQSIGLAEVDSVWVRKNSAKTGAIVGGVTLGVLGAVAMRAFALAVCEGSSNCNDVGAAFLGGVVGAIGGAFIGAGIGSLSKRWQRRYP